MIDLVDLNRRLVEQDEQLRRTLTTLAGHIDDDALRTIAELLAEGLATLHERQGNLIELMLLTAR
ncbi:MAG: hypothetical protein ABIW84_02135 [Ilumatobacteraceae bacterium]